MSHLNDNLYHNMNLLSIRGYDKDEKYHKMEFGKAHINKAVEDLVDHNAVEAQNKILNKAVDRILLTHRNTGIFLLFMSGPFLFFLMLIKYSIKLFVLMFLVKKKKGGSQQQETPGDAAPASA